MEQEKKKLTKEEWMEISKKFDKHEIPEFPKAFRGYECDEVDLYLNRLVDAYEGVCSELLLKENELKEYRGKEKAIADALIEANSRNEGMPAFNVLRKEPVVGQEQRNYEGKEDNMVDVQELISTEPQKVTASETEKESVIAEQELRPYPVDERSVSATTLGNTEESIEKSIGIDGISELLNYELKGSNSGAEERTAEVQREAQVTSDPVAVEKKEINGSVSENSVQNVKKMFFEKMQMLGISPSRDDEDDYAIAGSSGEPISYEDKVSIALGAKQGTSKSNKTVTSEAFDPFSRSDTNEALGLQHPALSSAPTKPAVSNISEIANKRTEGSTNFENRAASGNSEKRELSEGVKEMMKSLGVEQYLERVGY